MNCPTCSHPANIAQVPDAFSIYPINAVPTDSNPLLEMSLHSHLTRNPLMQVAVIKYVCTNGAHPFRVKDVSGCPACSIKSGI